MSSGNWGPPQALTKVEHDRMLAVRNGRPVTQDPMRVRGDVDDTAPDLSQTDLERFMEKRGAA